ncbi:MAG: hybrid sensor histidine kinase/response regulator [Gemmatimonadetes bacterium]|nr:MAG: hybrid sensor histidine kinase/response regulator [Gemmatimonadota bacterium]
MSVRILLLEDVPADAALIQRELTKAGLVFVSQRVDTRVAFEEALGVFAPDVILSDHGLPNFDGAAALQLVKERFPALPVILVTGSLNEETAVEFMKAGAADYVLKDHLTRLPQAIKRALRESRLREERELAVAALRASEEQYRALFENTPYPMWVFDLETHRLLAVNGAAIAHYGYRREEFLTLKIEDLRPPEDIPALEQHLATKEAGYHTTGPWRHRKKDGTLIEVQTSGHEITFAGRRAELVVIDDVTERKRLEEQFRQAQKMEAVGRLAAGVAHDFNNLLTAILGTTDLMIEDLPADDPDREGLLDIRGAAERAAVLTRQLLTFSRQQVVSPRMLRLNELITDLVKLLRRLLGEDVTIASALAPDCGAVKADPGQLEQVLVNLAVNARDAMPNGGRLTIETKNVDLDADYPTERVMIPAGRYVMLAVTDNGTGMDAQTNARIFEPFFTTKPVGKGTGLGLATVYGVVQQSGGYIWLYSELGHGTSFKIYLPRVDADGPQPAEEEQRASALDGSETVLVAEDEEAVRLIIAKALEARGYRVLSARDGTEALELAAGHGRIDLLVTDVVMPDMNGRELSRRFTEARPNLRTLYLSGYTDDAMLHRGVLQEGVAFLQKPFSLGALARKVRDVIEARP